MNSSLPPPAPDPRGDSPLQTSELRLKRDLRGRTDDDEDDDDLEASRPTLPRVPPRMRPSIPTDIEQLLPISQAVKSLPRPPRMPVVDASLEGTPRRMPWASVGVFAFVLSASAFSLLHYAEAPAGRVRGEALGGNSAQARAEPAEVSSLSRGGFDHSRAQQPGASTVVVVEEPSTLTLAPEPALSTDARAALRAHVGAAWSAQGRERAPLLHEAHHALAVGYHPLAEDLYRTLHRVHPAGSALGLAEIERTRGNRTAAERWTHRALTARPRDARAHRLAAELLEDRGQHTAAGLERSLARALEPTSR